MSGKFQPIYRDTAYLLPPSLQDWLPEKHLARFVVDIVDQLDLSELVKRYGGGGKQPYHPAVLLALLFYGYATGVFSSRKLEEQLRREVQELLRRAEQADAEDEPEIDIPDELARREDRLAAIKKAKEEIERRAQERVAAEQAEHEEKLKKRKEKEEKTGQKARGRKPKPPQAGPRERDQVNFTDEESRIMPSSDGFVQAYNAQAAVDIDTHLIIENHITQQPNDKQEIEPTLKQLNAVEDKPWQARWLAGRYGLFQRGQREAL